jgi:hypothetical protein
MKPRIRVNIAYAEGGAGRPLVAFGSPTLTHVELGWELLGSVYQALAPRQPLATPVRDDALHVRLQVWRLTALADRAGTAARTREAFGTLGPADAIDDHRGR